MISIAVISGVLVAAIAWVALLLSMRGKRMRMLASRLNFEYLDKNLPERFSLSQPPFEKITCATGVIHGKRNGVDLCVFDGILGNRGSGSYRTFIGVQDGQMRLSNATEMLGHALQSAEWTILYGNQKNLGLIPWSMNTREIEKLISTLPL
ncbi:MAG TPA: hypothetical protein VGF88_02630 [Acidobacteriaceae bacterium]|jgi:hypothetical protein